MQSGFFIYCYDLFVAVWIDEPLWLLNGLCAVGIGAASACPVAIIPVVVAPLVVIPIAVWVAHIIEVEINQCAIVVKCSHETSGAETIVVDIDGGVFFDEVHVNHTIVHRPVDMVCYIVPRCVAIVVNPVSKNPRGYLRSFHPRKR